MILGGVLTSSSIYLTFGSSYDPTGEFSWLLGPGTLMPDIFLNDAVKVASMTHSLA
jgi:hypothetical protein